MFQRYRKHAILLGEWHFHPECSRWPETDYVEDDFPYPEDFCLECVRIYSSRTPFPTPLPLYEGQRSILKPET